MHCYITPALKSGHWPTIPERIQCQSPTFNSTPDRSHAFRVFVKLQIRYSSLSGTNESRLELSDIAAHIVYMAPPVLESKTATAYTSTQNGFEDFFTEG